jgi:hypothetical protein
LDSVSVNDGGFGFATEQLHDLLRFAGPEILPRRRPGRRALRRQPDQPA